METKEIGKYESTVKRQGRNAYKWSYRKKEEAWEIFEEILAKILQIWWTYKCTKPKFLEKPRKNMKKTTLNHIIICHSYYMIKKKKSQNRQKKITYGRTIITVIKDFLAEIMRFWKDCHRVFEVQKKKKKKRKKFNLQFYTQKKYLSNMKMKAIASRPVLTEIVDYSIFTGQNAI